MAGILAILGAVLLLGIILRVGTAALVVTGLSRDVARFQVRSAFFGVGFTTTEAEMVVNHPARRRVVQALMLLGAIGITGVIGSAVLTLARNEGSLLMPLVTLAVGLVGLWALAMWAPLDRFLIGLFEGLLRRWTDLDTHDYTALLRLSSEYAIQQFTLEPNGPLDGHSLVELQPRAAGLVLLGIERADGGEYLGAPAPDTVLHGGDTVTIYGRNEVLATLGG
jgi:hypothetical protein